jgi:hypothetical protein
MMPQLMRLRVHSAEGQRFRLWIPLLPVFLVLSPLLLLALLVLLVVCLVYHVNPGRAFAAGWHLITGLRGLRVEVEQGRNTVLVHIS